MTRLLIFSILLYRRFAPASIRDRCIFSFSCSSYVLEGAREAGVREAYKRFEERWRKCRPGYARLLKDQAIDFDIAPVILADGSTVSMRELSLRVRQELS